MLVRNEDKDLGRRGKLVELMGFVFKATQLVVYLSEDRI
jgi:hypothetical protein